MKISDYTVISESIKDKMSKEDLSGEIRVWHDPSVMKTDDSNDNAHDEQSESVTNNKLKEQGLNSAMNKDERMFKLITNVKNGTYQNIEDAVDDLDINIGTVNGYLKESGIVLYDKDGKKYGAKRKNSRASTHYNYYDCDPESEDSQIISESDHKLRVYSSTKEV